MKNEINKNLISEAKYIISFRIKIFFPNMNKIISSYEQSEANKEKNKFNLNKNNLAKNCLEEIELKIQLFNYQVSTFSLNKDEELRFISNFPLSGEEKFFFVKNIEKSYSELFKLIVNKEIKISMKNLGNDFEFSNSLLIESERMSGEKCHLNLKNDYYGLFKNHKTILFELDLSISGNYIFEISKSIDNKVIDGYEKIDKMEISKKYCDLYYIFKYLDKTNSTIEKNKLSIKILSSLIDLIELNPSVLTLKFDDNWLNKNNSFKNLYNISISRSIVELMLIEAFNHIYSVHKLRGSINLNDIASVTLSEKISYKLTDFNRECLFQNIKNIQINSDNLKTILIQYSIGSLYIEGIMSKSNIEDKDRINKNNFNLDKQTNKDEKLTNINNENEKTENNKRKMVYSYNSNLEICHYIIESINKNKELKYNLCKILSQEFVFELLKNQSNVYYNGNIHKLQKNEKIFHVNSNYIVPQYHIIYFLLKFNFSLAIIIKNLKILKETIASDYLFINLFEYYDEEVLKEYNQNWNIKESNKIKDTDNIKKSNLVIEAFTFYLNTISLNENNKGINKDIVISLLNKTYSESNKSDQHILLTYILKTFQYFEGKNKFKFISNLFTADITDNIISKLKNLKCPYLTFITEFFFSCNNIEVIKDEDQILEYNDDNHILLNIDQMLSIISIDLFESILKLKNVLKTINFNIKNFSGNISKLIEMKIKEFMILSLLGLLEEENVDTFIYEIESNKRLISILNEEINEMFIQKFEFLKTRISMNIVLNTKSKNMIIKEFEELTNNNILNKLKDIDEIEHA